MKPVRIGIIGSGNVGSGTLQILSSNASELQAKLGFPLQVTAEYLGMAGKKTVVRIKLSSPELSKAASSAGVRAFAGELRGTFSRGADMVEAFRYPVAGDVTLSASGDLPRVVIQTCWFDERPPLDEEAQRLRSHLLPRSRSPAIGRIDTLGVWCRPRLGRRTRPRLRSSDVCSTAATGSTRSSGKEGSVRCSAQPTAVSRDPSRSR